MTRHIPTRAARAAAITALIAALSSGASALNTAVLGGLDSPRGIAVGPAGRLIYAEISGAISELIANGKNAGTTKLLNSVPETFIAPNVATLGGQIFVLTAGGAPGSGSNTLYRVNNGTIKALADCRDAAQVLGLRISTREPDEDELGLLPRSVFYQD